MRSAVVAAAVLLLGAGWPAASHDARRTGQSDVRGPRSAERTASVILTAEQNINMAVTIADDGTVYAGTWGVVRSGGSSDVASWNKFDGKLFAFHRSLEPRWTAPLDRVPYCYLSMAHVVFAAPALSPDEKTVYVAGAWGPRVDAWETTLRGAIYALDAATGALKWTFEPVNEAVWWKPTVWTTELAAGTDGTLYAAGTELTFGGGSAVVFALRDQGDRASYAWPRMIDIDLDHSVLANGLALRETGGVTRRVYATSGDGYSHLLQGYDRGGKLVAIEASSGSLLWSFDPETHGGTGAMTGIAIDAEGVVYTGVSGRRDGGRLFAIREDGSLLWQFTLGGLLEWAHPVLGPRGDLYAGDSRRCLLNAYPVESGICSAVSIDPRVYVVWKRSPRTPPCESGIDASQARVGAVKSSRSSTDRAPSGPAPA
ncbi:MAG TPA: PQQ-binding-like beta-propeller repeat protein [Thermoanaerobaculia bacterium]|nr:PQQ-binding-like beta-propeller repeat protein [Thermoanaerobaculia bacterium]